MADAQTGKHDFLYKKAQRSFAQALKGQDVPSETTKQFRIALEAVLQQNTPRNIQVCKQWIIKHLGRFPARLKLLGEYLVAISKSYSLQDSEPLEAVRKQLGIIVVINDVLHSAKFHVKAFKMPVEVLTPYIKELTSLVARKFHEQDTPPEKKLKAVINFWRINEVLNGKDLHAMGLQLRQILRNAHHDASSEPEAGDQTLPQTLDGRKSAWHRVAPAYILESITEDSSRPIYQYSNRIPELDKQPPIEDVDNFLASYFSDYVKDHGDVFHLTGNEGAGNEGAGAEQAGGERVGDKQVDDEQVDDEQVSDEQAGVSETYNQWLSYAGQRARKGEAKAMKASSSTFGFSRNIGDDIEENHIPQDVVKMREQYEDRGMDTDDRRARGGRRPDVSDLGRSSDRPHTLSQPGIASESYGHAIDRSRSPTPCSIHEDGPSIQDSHESYRDRDLGPRYDNRNRNQGRASQYHSRDATQHQSHEDIHLRGPHLNKFKWQNYDGQSNTSDVPKPNATYNEPYPPAGGPPNASAPGFPLPFPPQFPSQFPMPPFPPPFPPGAMPGIPPPPLPPPNFSSQFPGAFPPMPAFLQNGFDAFGNSSNIQNQVTNQLGAGLGNTNQRRQHGSGIHARIDQRGNYQGTNHQGTYRGGGQ